MDYYEKSEKDKAAVVQAMFDNVAPDYDFFNRTLSLGLDILWRKIAVKELFKGIPEKGLVLDMGCGSGDLSGEIKSRSAVVGMDFCRGMLKESRKKFKNLPLVQGDATCLPFRSESVRGVISAFVVRNVSSVESALKEVHRSLLPQGRFVILEFSLPKNPLLRWGFLTYLRLMFPIACGLFGGDKEAYRYLRKSIFRFGKEVDLKQKLEEAGFCDVRQRTLLGGGVGLYSATKA